MDGTSEPLKCQTWFLKVSIHCEGCRRKVKKVLQNIDGVFTTTIDPQQQKVTVTGSVGVETLIRKLAKAGKHAEVLVLPENVAGKGKDSSNKAKKKKKNEQRDQENAQNHSSAKKDSNKIRGIENAEKCNGESKSSNSKTGSPDKSPAGGQAPEKDHNGGQSEGGTGKSGGGDSGKKRKIKKARQNGGGTGSNELSAGSGSVPAHTGSQLQCTGQVVGQVNLSPTRQQSYLYPETCCYPPNPMVHFASYNRLCPSPMGTMGGPSYYVPTLPYMCADPYQFQSAPLISFEIFSDENANGCSVM